MLRRQHLNEEKERQVSKLAALEKATVNRVTIEMLKNRLQRNLDNATEDDWRFILDTLKAKVLAFGDGSWDIAIDVPLVSETDSIVNNTGWCICLY